MGSYATQARYHAKKIERHHDHGGKAGYLEAKRHYGEMQELMRRAFRAKNSKSKSDVAIIRLLMASCTPLMDAMKLKQDNG